MSKSTKPAAKPAAKKSVKKAGTPLRERLGALLTSAPEVRLSIRVKMVIYMSIIFLTMLGISLCTNQILHLTNDIWKHCLLSICLKMVYRGRFYMT